MHQENFRSQVPNLFTTLPCKGLESLKGEVCHVTFFWQAGAWEGGQTPDLLVFVYFLSTLKQRLRPLGYFSPQEPTLFDGNGQFIKAGSRHLY